MSSLLVNDIVIFKAELLDANAFELEVLPIYFPLADFMV
jgi:hypothetical protein